MPAARITGRLTVSFSQEDVEEMVEDADQEIDIVGSNIVISKRMDLDHLRGGATDVLHGKGINLQELGAPRGEVEYDGGDFNVSYDIEAEE